MIHRLRRCRVAVSMASLWILLVQIGLGMFQIPDATYAVDLLAKDQICTVDGISESVGSPSAPSNPDHHGSNHDCGLCGPFCAAGGCSVANPSEPIVFLPLPSSGIPVAYFDGSGADANYFPRSYSRAPPTLV